MEARFRSLDLEYICTILVSGMNFVTTNVPFQQQQQLQRRRQQR